ncbi:MAG: DNA polymerase III subunit epsilon [Rhodocyclaceae bacterium]|jgi:DNA polymerase-3 subunit epsilon|nr:DNA polymerase III subunit epsilon [Rhodocyclaceae bacterium]MCE2722217.1 DNA polymerase III subunit epsilon [Betaproteobacteria bacterium]MCA3027223.1 DNA polymerase III subunit epsilon [Rhodocyclaceae bacterium]MCA3030640.1 DNA polymerase III subunit epsilon [Rhodocyclaceae bacterium]MCA3035794.1 DNA polymerase III subunit epsilon [Rhodocyclaceae bacterium]
MSRLIFLDTETTGLEVPQGHRIIEIACVEMIDRRFTENNFHTYLNPEREIDAAAQNIHGLSLELLADKPRFADIVDDFLRYIDGGEIVIHNAAFDVGFLNAELKRAGRAPIDGPDVTTGKTRVITDTWKMAREQFPGKKNSLDALCERFEIDKSARTLHGARVDTQLLAEVYLALTRGQDSLDIGLGASHNTSTKKLIGTALVRPANLRVLRASAYEIAAHHVMVEGLQKASGGKAVWANLRHSAKTVN